MPRYSETLDRLIAEFERLPGIGAKTAERLAFHVLRSGAEEAMGLARAIRDVKAKIRPCAECFNIAEGGGPCAVCADAGRDRGLVCVVEQPKDLLALERTARYRGLYHVLLGRLAPLEGAGPERLTVDALVERVRRGGVREVILATNPDLEGDGRRHPDRQGHPVGQLDRVRQRRDPLGRPRRTPSGPPGIKASDSSKGNPRTPFRSIGLCPA
jgi:recombination protein RecR